MTDASNGEGLEGLLVQSQRELIAAQKALIAELLGPVLKLDAIWSEDGANPQDARDGRIREIWGEFRAAIRKATGATT